MKVDFQRLYWQDYPSQATPINAENLNRLEEGMAGLYSDVSEIEEELDEGVGEYVTDWLNDHVDPVGSAVVDDNTKTNEGAAADAKKTGDEINSVKEEVFYPSSTAMSSTSSAPGWRLNDNGLSYSDSGYKIERYSVTVGDLLTVVSDDKFQFQTVPYVPPSGESNRVGKTYGSGKYVVEVPETATYLILSTPSESGSSVYSTTSIKDRIENFSDFTTGAVTLESGTFQDANGKVKIDQKARIRCSKIICITNSLNSVKVPDGYDIWFFYFDENQVLLGNSNTWRKGYIKFIDIVPDATRYINFVIKKHDAASADISSEIETVQSNLIFFASQYARCLPIWNISGGGIELAGDKMIIHPNGFAIIFNGNVYYIAATDHISETVITPPYANAIACIDTKKLGDVGGRTNPSDCIVFSQTYGDYYNHVPDFYIPIAYWFNSNYGFVFVGDFAYFEHYYQSIRNTKSAYQSVSSLFSENHFISHARNTVTTLNSAITSGYKFVEFDVVYTSDGIPVISHDLSFTIDGTTYVIAENAYNDLIAVKSDLAKLEDMLIICKKANVVCDIDYTKESYTDAQITTLYTLITSYGMGGRCFVTAESGVIANLMNKDNKLNLCLTNGSPTTAVFSDDKSVLVKIISVRYDNVTAEYVKTAHANGLLVKAWTVDTESVAENLYDMGVDLIITNSISPI